MTVQLSMPKAALVLTGAMACWAGSAIAAPLPSYPATIGQKVSSGCISMLNADVIDLFSRVDIGTKIIVLPSSNYVATVAPPAGQLRAVGSRSRNLRTSGIY